MTDTEARRLEIQASLDHQKSKKQRNMLGQFATPPALASDILRYAKALFPEDELISFLDPAIGTGAFYSAFTEQFSAQMIRRARGVEIDPHYGLPTVELWAHKDIDIMLADFTALEFPEKKDQANLLICNPPYVRHHHMTSKEKARLTEKSVGSAGISLNGLTGLYCHFMAIAHSWLEDGGLAGWLIPSEFMDVNYGKGLRRYLSESVELLQIHRFDPSDMQFGDAQVSSAIVWFRKLKPIRGHTAKFSFGGRIFSPRLSREVSIDELRTSRKWTALAEGPVVNRTNSYRLSDFFRIKRGLATGDNRFFILSEDRVQNLNIPREFLQPVLPSPRYVGNDFIDSDENGNPSIERKLYLLDCDLSEEEVRVKSESLFRYLQSGKERAGTTYLCSRRRPWYSQELRPAAPIVCTYMGRNLSAKTRPFRFIRNRSNATALNVYLMLYPTPMLANALEFDALLLDRIWQFLNTIPASSLLGEGRVYGGGLYKMEPKELANLPVDPIADILSEKAPVESQSELFKILVA